MAENMLDYQGILADMEAKKAVLEQAIASLRAALAAGALGQPGDIPAGSLPPGSLSMSGPMELPVGALLNKSVPAAIKLYLSTCKKKQTTQQIAAALKAGGVESTSSDFETVVAGALHRLKVAKEVLRFPDGWGFAELYPEHIRKAISEESKPNQKKKKVAKTKAKKDPTVKAQIVPITKGLEQRIEAVLKAANGKPLSPAEVAKTLEAGVKGVALALGRMAVKNKAEKYGDGKYRAPITETQRAG